MSITKGTKLKKSKKAKAGGDASMGHAKLTMSIAKGTKLKKSKKAAKKPSIPAWVKEEMAGDKAE